MRGVVFIGVLVAGYVAGFVVLEPRIGDTVVSLTMVPIVAAAWLYGRRGGVAVSLLLVVVNIALLQTVGGQHGFRVAEIPRVLIAVGLGYAAGWAREVTRRQRQLLADNLRIEAELRASQGDLERAVIERTADLVQANESLRSEMTARKELEARAAAADRMAVIGTLTAGIGHEINNPLAVIAANLEFLALRLPQNDPDVGDAIQDARSAAQRAGEIVRHMRVFIQSGTSAGVADVRMVIDSTVRMVSNEIRHRARLDIDVEGAPAVALAPAQLSQILLNLLVNASHALPARPAEENRIRIMVRPSPGSDRVRLEVSDTGNGIPAELHGRIFDPFVTTKPSATGTGLGLWVCQQIVTSAGGEIGVESSPGHGTTFRVDLPPAPRIEDASVSAPAPTPVRRARLLVIDDDPLVGRSIGRVVRGRHDVVVTDDAPRALAELEAGERYDVILCDLMMPVMNGAEFCARLRQRVPEQADRVIVMTGGAITADARELIDDPSCRRLDKPFATDALEAAIEQVLDAAAGTSS